MAASRQSPPKRESKGRLGNACAIVVASLIAWAVTGSLPGWDPPPEPLPAPIPVPAPKPNPQPEAHVLPEPDPRPAPETQSSENERGSDYSPAVRRRYERADVDGSGTLSWDELARFQRQLVSDIPYAENRTALSPNEFLSAGRGDCEDFALFTCGLLRYWGVDCYLGSLSQESNASGHAIALIPVGQVPKGFAYYDVNGNLLSRGADIPSGTYVPVDYQYVGGLSNAAGKNWTLRWIRVPENAYGLPI